MRKHFLLILLLFCSIKVTAQETSGLWQFNSITKNFGDTLLSVSEDDFMEIKSEGTFHYELKAKNNLVAKGTWDRTDDLLCFNYTVPSDTIRCYTIQINGNELTLNENDVNFSFIKKETIKVINEKTETSRLQNIIRGIIGLTTLLLIAFACSRNRKKINWELVFKGLFIQFIFAIGILKVPFVANIFNQISKGFVKVISFTQAGTDFLFASFITGKIEAPMVNFMVQVLPTIIFFSALTSLFYYLGILQKVVYFFAWMMKKFMKTLRL